MLLNQGAVYSLRKQRAHEMPRLLQLFYKLTWDRHNVFSSFWMPRETLMIELCDRLSKYAKFDSVVLSDNSVKLEFKSESYNFTRVHLPVEKLEFLLDKFISEWELFKKYFPFPSITRNMSMKKVRSLMHMISLIPAYLYQFLRFIKSLSVSISSVGRKF